MKILKILALFLCICIIFSVDVLSYAWINPPNFELSEGEKLVNQILYDSAKSIQEKYPLKAAGEGAGMPGGIIEKFNLSFDVRGPLTKECLRKYLIECADEMLVLIQRNEKIQQYLKKTPADINYIHIIIFVSDETERDEVYDPWFASAQISHGRLYYKTIDKENTYKYKHRFEESYEEALEELKQHPCELPTPYCLKGSAFK